MEATTAARQDAGENLPISEDQAPRATALEPLASPSSAAQEPHSGIALCLSGGGYRAMLFHAGSLIRLNEAALLSKIDRISSVSGGSVTAGVLGARWHSLNFDETGVARRLFEEVITPLCRLASHTIDVGAILGGLLGLGTAGNRLASAYRKSLFGHLTLQDLPDHPRFVINATNLQTQVLWRFSKPYMADYLVGMIKQPKVELALAVAASSAFPPLLSPVRLFLDPSRYDGSTRPILHRSPYTTNVVLCDGGVYDNLGLETAWKTCKTIFVSDGGGKTGPDESPRSNWISQSIRALEIIDNQVRSLRKRQVIDSFVNGTRLGTYWSVRSRIDDYNLPDPLLKDTDKNTDPAQLSTRLRGLDAATQERLINWGYALCDAALRKHYAPDLPRPRSLVYPRVGV
jgi:NTE family protein